MDAVTKKFSYQSPFIFREGTDKAPSKYNIKLNKTGLVASIDENLVTPSDRNLLYLVGKLQYVSTDMLVRYIPALARIYGITNIVTSNENNAIKSRLNALSYASLINHYNFNYIIDDEVKTTGYMTCTPNAYSILEGDFNFSKEQNFDALSCSRHIEEALKYLSIHNVLCDIDPIYVENVHFAENRYFPKQRKKIPFYCRVKKKNGDSIILEPLRLKHDPGRYRKHNTHSMQLNERLELIREFIDFKKSKSENVTLLFVVEDFDGLKKAIELYEKYFKYKKVYVANDYNCFILGTTKNNIFEISIVDEKIEFNSVQNMYE